MNVKWTRLVVCCALAAAGVALLAAAAGASPADTPVVTGCPAGFSLFAVGTGPYKVPGRLDSPANGGNGDGYVCALTLPDAVRDEHCMRGELGACLLQQAGLPLYLFNDNNNPARGASTAIPDDGS
jgi:hypothetical protein